MATTLKFDELNRFEYRDYFGKMYIKPEQMRKRIDLAKDIEDVMLYMFAYWVIAADAEIPLAEIKRDVGERLTSAVEKHLKLDPYIREHITKVVDEVADVTAKRDEKRKRQELDELDDMQALQDEKKGFDWEAEEESEADEQNYWTSRERAMLISANEANAFENYNEYREAKAQGKTKKKWLTMMDEKVRLDHSLAEGQTVDIDGLFLIGGYEMMFPMDASNGAPAGETINCRCSCEYL